MKGNQLMRKPKLLRALLILLFVAAPIQWTRAQIVLSTPKTTLGAVIKNIKSQSNYQFFYDDKLAEMPVNAIDVKNGSLQSVLDAALQGKGITYKIEDNIVYLSASGEPQTPQQTGQEHTVTGTVVDATGEALIGVNVQVKGNPTAGTITDFEGNYSLSVPGNGEIVFSYIGYRSETLKPDGKNVLNVTMQEDTQQIGEVDIKKGCANFARLWGQTPFFILLGKEYARSRGMDEEECVRLVLHYRKKFWNRYRRRHQVWFQLDI